MLPAAERLVGITLADGWTVVSPIQRGPHSTGGYFSKCYIVQDGNGKQAFLKALDFSKALQSPDPATMLQAMTEAFNFERDVLTKCKHEHLDRVVVAITDGIYRFGSTNNSEVVQYLIFELADGDVRRQAQINDQFDKAWSLRSLHHIATGLQQLHTYKIAHQDLKPSNVLVFNGNTSKLADLGRAAYQGHTPPHENDPVPGDRGYAPPELLYGYPDQDWKRKRFGCDMYLLGSMAVFFFQGVGMTPLLRKELPEPYCWDKWGGTFDEVLPYLRDAFQRVVENYRKSLPEPLRKDLPEVVQQLCEPDPRLRGHKLAIQAGNQFSLERYISKFNILASYAEQGYIDMLPL